MSKPPHIFIDQTSYFITVTTKNNVRFFNTKKKKDLIIKAVNLAVKKYQYKIFAWVILDNHYHLLLDVAESKNLPKFIQAINGSSSRWLHCLENNEDGQTDSLPSVNKVNILNQNEALEGGLSVRPSKNKWEIWDNYWDEIVEEETPFWKSFNYIHHNPVKHGYSKNEQDYRFSSYQYYLKTKGQDWLDSIREEYPIIDYHYD